MKAESKADDDALALQLRHLILNVIRAAGPDLSCRQLAILMLCATIDETQTVTGLSEKLDIGKAAVSRAVNRLAMLGLARRKLNLNDQRSAFVVASSKGKALCRRMAASRNVDAEAAG
jgi:DNA-binding MarR family transcriptional regulator